MEAHFELVCLIFLSVFNSSHLKELEFYTICNKIPLISQSSKQEYTLMTH